MQEKPKNEIEEAENIIETRQVISYREIYMKKVDELEKRYERLLFLMMLQKRINNNNTYNSLIIYLILILMLILIIFF